jgi:hypothetical protein
MGDMMKSMQEMMNRCSQMMAAGGSASALPLDAALAKLLPTLFSRPVGTPTPSPTPSMGDMMKSMQEMMNRCSQMMAAGGMGGTNGMQPAG